ncbi:DNA-directed RNA polymerase [Syncephalis fuscata]|nr:DNA-directed RNA polymerase [Syncephalis fuscata]
MSPINTEGKIVLESDHVNNRHSESNAAWNIKQFAESFSINVVRISRRAMEFDMLNLEAPIANAFRRILMAEIPTMAIETVFMMQNTSVIHDEVLCHRLGLIPIKVDPTQFQWKGGKLIEWIESIEWNINCNIDAEATDLNTIVFKLDVNCSANPKTGELVNANVYSRDLVWEPKGNQAAQFAKAPIRAAYKSILVAKLRPGQSIQAELHCEKGIGRDHAKYSPVATAYYRLMPEIVITQDIVDADADKFAKCFVPGVIKIVKERGVRKAMVDNPRLCTMNREALRHDEFKNKVKIMHKPTHFIFNIESTGAMTPPELVLHSIKRLMRKCQTVQAALAQLNSNSDDDHNSSNDNESTTV